MSRRTIISYDLVKKIIEFCNVNKYGEVFFNKAMSPLKTKELLANSSPCVVAMESYASFISGLGVHRPLVMKLEV
jgi:hypothetical protein